MLYHRLLTSCSCLLKAILDITTTATLKVLVQTQPCQLWKVTGRHERLAFLCWYNRGVRLTVSIKASRTRLFTVFDVTCKHHQMPV